MSLKSGKVSPLFEGKDCMNNTPVYLVVNITVQDQTEYRKYEKGFFGILKKYGGSLVALDDNAINFEGFSPRSGRMIIVSFPSEEVAKEWYADAEYQQLSEHRRAGAPMEFLTMVRGVPPRQ
jgi:uncharacterized protein (DUF1330 family)